MATVKRIVCLANSRKPGGRCVAGIELSKGERVGWVRPVSGRKGQEVWLSERRYEDKSDPRVLDVVKVPLREARPKNHQRENWLVDSSTYWEKVGRFGWKDLKSLADEPGPLWINGYSTQRGINDKVPLARISEVQDSLRLIRVDGLVLSVSTQTGFGKPRKRVHAEFMYAGEKYRLWVTDPEYEEEYKAKPNGDYKIGKSFLTVSLTEPFEDGCFKLVAAIIEHAELPKE